MLVFRASSTCQEGRAVTVVVSQAAWGFVRTNASVRILRESENRHSLLLTLRAPQSDLSKSVLLIRNQEGRKKSEEDEDGQHREQVVRVSREQHLPGRTSCVSDVEHMCHR